jgi:hypothetical protein
MHECGEPTGIVVLDAAVSEPDAQTVVHADVRPLTIVEPAVGLEADERQERDETPVADHGADDADSPQDHAADCHGEGPETGGQPFTSRRTIRPASLCKSAGFNKLSVGFKSMSIQYTLPVRLRSAIPGLNPNA